MKGVTSHITNTLNQEPNLDGLVKAVCKYRSVNWLKNCLTKSKKQRDLSIVHFNVIWIVCGMDSDKSKKHLFYQYFALGNYYILKLKTKFIIPVI